mgnify:CR=1 FL=1
MKSVIYANVWQRLIANAIDGMIILVLMLIISSLAYIDFSIAFAAVLVSYLGLWYYGYYFHSRFGATLGKHIVGIIVVDNDLNRFTESKAFKRSIIDMTFAALGAGLGLTALFAMDYNHFSSLPFFAREEYLEGFKLPIASICATAYGYWLLSECIVMQTNKQRKGLQDMIAGTKVIVKNPQHATIEVS